MSAAAEPDVPVLIVGAGPVGLVLALLLARHGVASTIVDAKPSRESSGSRAICVQGDVLDILDRVGVGAELASAGVTWDRGRTYHRDQELFTTTFPDSGRRAFPPFVNIGQDATEALLWRAVDAEPSIAVELGHRLAAIRQDFGSVRAVLQTSEGDREIRARYVVGSDGSRSSTRHQLGLPFEGMSFSDQFLIADIRADLPFGNERRFFFDPEWNPGRQVLVHPQPDSVWRIDWQVPETFDLAADERSGALDDRIRRIVGDRDYQIVWLSVYRFHSRLAPTFHLGRVFLAGDSAHLVAPFGARGMNSGIQDAENLAWKLARVLHRRSASDLLDSYTIERRAAALENLAVTSATMRFLVPHSDQAWETRRRILESALTDETLRRRVDSGKLAEPYWYLDSPLTTPGPRAAPIQFPTAPGRARPPVAGVLCPDGPCAVAGRRAVTRLRQLFGTRPVLLVADARDAEALRATASAFDVDLHHLGSIDVDGVLAGALDVSARSVHVIRPDGHLAAVLDGPRDVADALRRCLRPADEPDLTDRLLLDEIASDLDHARVTRTPVAPPTEMHRALPPGAAYAVSRRNITRRVEDGARLVGHKVGLTAEAMQRMLGVDQPDYGALLDDMAVTDGGSVPAGSFCQPRVEPEIAFRLARPVRGPGITAADVIDAADAVAPALEIIDSRVENWRIAWWDTVADNASSGGFVVGAWQPVTDGLADLDVSLLLNGQVVEKGNSSAVLGDPALAVAWLANTLAELGDQLDAGEVILPGSCTRAVDVRAGSHAEASFTGLGSVSVRFEE